MNPPPSMPMYSGAWFLMVCRVHPNLARWLVRISPPYFRQACHWLMVYERAYRAWLLEPPKPMWVLSDGRIVVASDGEGR